MAIGYEAGKTSQGINAVAIGFKAGKTTQHDNSIVINSSGIVLETDGTGRFFVKHIRGFAHGFGMGRMHYDDGSGEITYSTS